jgi:glycosyltransferase involved in cell wall biosynthesis
MIRLLSLQPVAERGGSDQALVGMLRSLPPAEFACHVAVPSEPPLRAELEAAGAMIHIVPMRRISTSHGIGSWAGYAAGWPVAATRLTRLARRIDADIVHSNSLHSWYGWAVATATRRPHVWSAREIVVQSGAALRVERSLARRADLVIAASQAVAAQLDRRNVVVVHENADAAVFRPSRAGAFRARVDIPDDVPVVATVGRIDTWKGIDVLLDAWPRAKAARSDLHLVVAGAAVRGKDDYFATLATRAGALADVHWLGPRDDVADLYADADVVVVPSTQPEPYGLVAVEALASGTPIIASDAGGLPEIVASAHPGAGTLVPPRDVDELATALVGWGERTGPTSTSIRAARPPLREPEPDRYAELLRGVVPASRP